MIIPHPLKRKVMVHRGILRTNKNTYKTRKRVIIDGTTNQPRLKKASLLVYPIKKVGIPWRQPGVSVVDCTFCLVPT